MDSDSRTPGAAYSCGQQSAAARRRGACGRRVCVSVCRCIWHRNGHAGHAGLPGYQFLRVSDHQLYRFPGGTPADPPSGQGTCPAGNGGFQTGRQGGCDAQISAGNHGAGGLACRPVDCSVRRKPLDFCSEFKQSLLIILYKISQIGSAFCDNGVSFGFQLFLLGFNAAGIFRV